jgi:hypothetical protein
MKGGLKNERSIAFRRVPKGYSFSDQQHVSEAATEFPLFD